MEGCEETVHREDAPGYYPCCERHPGANKSFWEMEVERRYYEGVNKELGIWTKLTGI